MPIIRLSSLLLDAKDGPFSYSSVLINLNEQMTQIAQGLIELDDLTSVEGYGNSVSDGLETDPHITVLYGLLDSDPFAVSGLLEREWGRPVEIVFGKTMVFDVEDYDVVVIEIISEDLKALHELIKDNLPNEQTYDYQPHFTLAYVKSGAGTKYDNLELDVTGNKVIIDEVVFSNTEGDFTEISLTT